MQLWLQFTLSKVCLKFKSLILILLLVLHVLESTQLSYSGCLDSPPPGILKYCLNFWFILMLLYMFVIISDVSFGVRLGMRKDQPGAVDATLWWYLGETAV